MEPPHGASLLIVRSFGSQMVALACASGQRLHVAIHSPLASRLLQPRQVEPLRLPGNGPRLVPSHASQPNAQPFENFVDILLQGASTSHTRER